ncbi:MAG: sigma-54-dependent Fis family transcriptional regulator [Acidobacteriota bacterium]
MSHPSKSLIEKLLSLQESENFLEILLSDYLKRFIKIADVSFGSFFIFKKEKDVFSLAAMKKIGDYEKKEKILKRMEEEGKKGIVPHVLQTMKPYITNDCEKDPFHIPFRKEKILSEMVIPFDIDSERIGIIVLTSMRKNHFNESNLKRIEPSINDFLYEFLSLEFYRFLKEKDKEVYLMPYDSYLKEIFPQIRKISSSDEPVLIEGLTGSGKEVISRFIHFLSKRKDKPFYPINCSSFPSEDLIQSELFGHEKGSFTGAWRKYQGKIKSADGGTLFLDEIQSSSLRFQYSLLRLIERGEIHPLGSERIEKSDVRIISACSSSPEKLLDEGKLLPPWECTPCIGQKNKTLSM